MLYVIDFFKIKNITKAAEPINGQDELRISCVTVDSLQFVDIDIAFVRGMRRFFKD